MKRKLIVALSIFGIPMLGSALWAEKNAELKTLICKASKVVVQEKFDMPNLPKGWVAAKGDFQVREGAIAGWEKKEDMHAAVLALQKPFKNSIIRFSFKRDGATGFNISFNHAKGHLFRVLINDDNVVINKDKDKNDKASKALVLGKAEAKFPPGVWHTMQIEMVGDRVAVQADNGVQLEAKNSGLEVEKTGYRWVTRGSTLYLDDVSIWDVQP
jgi:hypothetical protein